jgi:hypothetical protein
MEFYQSAAKNALAFFAIASRTALQEDVADYDTLKRIATAKFARQRAAIGLDAKKSAEAFAAAAADTAKRSHTIATAAMNARCEALQDVKQLRLVTAAVAAASPHVLFCLRINNMSERMDLPDFCRMGG